MKFEPFDDKLGISILLCFNYLWDCMAPL